MQCCSKMHCPFLSSRQTQCASAVIQTRSQVTKLHLFLKQCLHDLQLIQFKVLSPNLECYDEIVLTNMFIRVAKVVADHDDLLTH